MPIKKSQENLTFLAKENMVTSTIFILNNEDFSTKEKNK